MSEEQRSDRVEAFIRDVLRLAHEYGVAISHEDGHGAFLIVDEDDDVLRWFASAFDETTGPR